MQRPFRFGVLCEEMGTREAWITKVRCVEELGYATLLLRDHLYRYLPPGVPVEEVHGRNGNLILLLRFIVLHEFSAIVTMSLVPLSVQHPNRNLQQTASTNRGLSGGVPHELQRRAGAW